MCNAKDLVLSPADSDKSSSYPAASATQGMIGKPRHLQTDIEWYTRLTKNLYLERDVGRERQERYWIIVEQLRAGNDFIDEHKIYF